MSKREIISVIVIATISFVFFGALTSVYENPIFNRMTPVYWFDYVFLVIESLLIGLYFGVKSPVCMSKRAGAGGVMGFLGFACPVCNKLLVLLFGAGFLLTYFEPIRPFVGLLGILLLSYVVYRKFSIKFSYKLAHE